MLSGLRNPSMLQMMLYGLLVIPKGLNNLLTSDICHKINSKVKDLEGEVLESTYTSDENGIDYLRHIRNAVSHCNTKYFTDCGVCYVQFYEHNNHS